MKRIATIVIVLIMLIGCTSKTSGLETLDEIAEFEIEEKAKINMAVFSDSFGKSMVSSWNKNNPKHKGMLTYEVLARDTKISSLEDIARFDLVSINHDQVPLLDGHMLALDDSFNANISDENIKHLTDELNKDEIVFMPIGYEGLLFAYHEDMLKAYGIALTDENNDGLPDAIDSFEKIAALKDPLFKENKYRKIEVQYLFPFPLNDQMAMFPFLNTGDYQFVDGVSGEDLVVDERLDQSIENLQDLGMNQWAKNIKNKDLVWNFEEVIEKETAPFLMVGNWMYYQQYEKDNEYNLRFAKMPSFKETELSPLVTVTGFVANKDTKYPVATQAVLKHIRKLEGIQSLLDVGVIPVVDRKLLEEANLKMNENQKDMIIAYGSSQIAPLQAFSQRSDIRVWDLYKEMDFRNDIVDAFSKQKSTQDIKQSILKKTGTWLNANGLKIDGVNRDVEGNNKKGNK